MLYAIPMALTVIMMFLTMNNAQAEGDGVNVPAHRCDKQLVRDIFKKEDSELMEAVTRHFVDQDSQGRTDEEFCRWLQARYNGNETVGTFETGCVRCEEIVPATVEVERSVPPDVRQRFRDVADSDDCCGDDLPPMRAQSSFGDSFRSFFSNPLVTALAGGVAGYFLGRMSGNNNNDRPSMFPPPNGGPWGRPGMRPMPPRYAAYLAGGSGGSQFGSSFAPPVNPWPGGNYYDSYLSGGSFGGGGGAVYRGPAPGVLPLAPQPYYPYSVAGSIPQQHWNLLNQSGR